MKKCPVCKSDIEEKEIGVYKCICGYTEITASAKSVSMDKEKQEFQLGDTAYMIDEDYRFFESEVYRIELRNSKYYYDTHDCDFEFKDIGDWGFKSEMYRELHLEAMM